MDPAQMTTGIVGAILVLGCLILLGVLFWSPIKLYGIHREAKRTNQLLMRTNELLGQILNRSTPASVAGDSSPDPRRSGNTT
jgi:hypothetical protein